MTDRKQTHCAACDRKELEIERLRNPWQPIETAPRDGAPVLLWEPGGTPCIVVGRWLEEETIDGCWIYADDALNDIDPEGPIATHWMPLPTPPKE